jgi:hypothetical protein
LGTRLGPYQIVAVLGEGGMGEVYRARDMRLGRDVAIKTLPASLVGDAERVARFEREAQILASLNHPHIASLHGLEVVGGSQFLVLELVEGDTLARRLGTGPIDLVEALTIARQVAGRWVAYMSRESGPSEVYVTSFPDKRVKSVISLAGGSLPRWNRNGKEILYLALDNTLIATLVNDAGPRFEVGTARPLFRVRPRPAARLDAYPYDLTSDGKKILVNTFVEESTTNPIMLVVNWDGAANR